MNFIGWGDPHHSIWFFGLEEGGKFSQEHINGLAGLTYSPVSLDADLNWPVANKISRILCGLLGNMDPVSYRDEVLWRAGSGSFNGNLLPLGKASRSHWAHEYDELFGIPGTELDRYINLVRSSRYPKIKKLRDHEKPQAIICFGKELWADFRDIFVDNEDFREIHEAEKIEVYPLDKVILCGHFSYGVHFTNKSLVKVVEILKSWGADPERLDQ